MKKSAFLLSLIMLLFVFSPAVSAVSLSEGTAALNNLFEDGKSSTGLDWVAFSPKKGDSDNTEYPLLVWLHGIGSGTTPRAQLESYEFSNWASDEYQTRFKNAGGCYLLAPRAATSSNNSWSVDMCASLKKTIDEYISANKNNIDKKRIYIGGYSAGGAMVWDMLSSYPDFFAAGLPAASMYQPTVNDLNKLNNVSVWMFSSDKDPYPLSESSDTKLAFDYLKGTTNRKSGIRFTTFTEAVFADGTKFMNPDGTMYEYAEHYIWEAITYDMHMSDGVTVYNYSTTTDGNDKTVNLDSEGIISWLSMQSRPGENENTADKVSFIDRIILLIRRIIDFLAGLFK